MSLPYISLFLAVISCFIKRQHWLTILLIVISLLFGLLYHIVDWRGLSYLMLLCGLAYGHHRSNDHRLKMLLLSLMWLAAAGLALHQVPGFHNMLAINQTVISSSSMPISVYLNFDKTIAGLILFLGSDLYHQERPLDRKAILQTLLSWLGCAVILVSLGLYSGYVKLDPKLPAVLALWSLNNLLFVCFAEEVIFRGILQNQLKIILPDNKLYGHILLTSLLFGLAHHEGGYLYIVLSSMAGYFYGLAYEKTNRVLSAMIVHFGVNLTHIVFFTYPAVVA